MSKQVWENDQESCKRLVIQLRMTLPRNLAPERFGSQHMVLGLQILVVIITILSTLELMEEGKMSKKILVLAFSIVLCGVQAGWTATVNLAWDPNSESDLAGYELHYGTSPGSYTEVEVIGRTFTAWTVTDLVEGNTYYFALKAFDTRGKRSGFSNEVWADIPETPPDEPLGKPGRPTYVP